MGRFTLNTFTILGILLGALTIVSLAQRAFDVGLAPIFDDILEYYRWFIETLKRYALDWWTLKFFDFSVPLWAMDLISIWALAIAGNIRVVRAQSRLALEVKGIRVENTMDRALRQGALRGLYERTGYFFVRQVLFAPFEYLTRPFRRLFRIVRTLQNTPYMRDAARGGRGSPSQSVIRNTVRFERQLVVVQLLPLFGAGAFFVSNAVVLAP